MFSARLREIPLQNGIFNCSVKISLSEGKKSDKCYISRTHTRLKR